MTKLPDIVDCDAAGQFASADAVPDKNALVRGNRLSEMGVLRESWRMLFEGRVKSLLLPRATRSFFPSRSRRIVRKVSLLND